MNNEDLQAEENENVLDDPHPVVSFEGFGDNSLTLLLRAFLDDISQRIPSITALHKAINHKFNDAGIVIAFPQRDLHLDTKGPLHLTIDGVGQAPSGAFDSNSSPQAR